MSRKNNVVFLVLDSLRKDRTSIYNDEVDFTPTLESIVDSSTVFENAVSQAPWTLPSHVSMFTGEYPWEHGVRQSRTYMKEDQETFIQKFNEEGYSTAAITPNVWITPHKGTTKDFDYVENFLGKADNKIAVKTSKFFTKIFDSLNQDLKKSVEKYMDRFFKFFNVDDSCKSEETVEEVQKYFSNVEKDEDFFLYVNLMEPHEPYHPPKKYMEKHGVKDKSKIPQRQKDLFTKNIDYEELRKIYDASMDYTDDLVKEIVDSLRENNLKDDTVLVVVSDHGQGLGEDDIFGHQFTVDQSVTDTLLMVDRPERKGNREEGLIEMRKLKELTPYYAGISEKPDKIFSEKVKGGYDYPACFIGYVPEDQWDKYYKKYQYIQTEETRSVRQVNQDGEEKITTINLDTGEEVETPEEIEEEFRSIERKEDEQEKETRKDEDRDEDEEIKERLEALGYS